MVISKTTSPNLITHGPGETLRESTTPFFNKEDGEGNAKDIPLNHPSWSLNYSQNLTQGNQNIHVVADLINSSSHSWKFDTVRSLYQQPTCNEILHIPLPNTEGGRDKVLWKHSISGEF